MIYLCEDSRIKLKKNNSNGDLISRRIYDIEKRSTLKEVGNITSFTGSIYVLKISKPKIRTIIEERNLRLENETIKVFFIRDIFMPSEFHRGYRDILPRLTDGTWVENNPLSDNDIEEARIQYINFNNNNKKDKKKPSENLTKWFDEFRLNLDNDIYETQSWVEYSLNNSTNNGMRDKDVNVFRILIENIRDNKDDTKKTICEFDNLNVYKYVEHNIGIIYSKINIESKDIIILINGAHIDSQNEYWENALNNIKSNGLKLEKNIESVSRNSYRSYPKWTLSNDELWFSIQMSKEVSNLSLTTEQSEFLRNFTFPYYINGQAGSGKSTMLYYIFSNVYYYKTQEIIKGDVVFLTENEKLLEDTKKYVNDLLRNNPEFDGLDDKQINDSKSCFFSFKEFLLDIIEESDRKNFQSDKYLNFSTFKYLYESSILATYIKNKYSAEECWFVIITYIYGYQLEERVTSENYMEIIPKALQVIDKEVFKGIEKDVLPYYEKLLEDGYWDKLKIIRFIYENINIKKRYSVIICDEAQDFCKVELHFILSMSEYLKYDLSTVSQVPVLFAGDPNQTVNPTGFREDEITSLLYSELENVGFTYNKASNLYSPTLNYRSSHSIVSLANFIQHYRVKNCGIKQKKPQEAKRPSSLNDREFNIFLSNEDIENNQDLENDLIEKLKYKIFIVPVDIQEKISFAKESNLLNKIKKAEIKTSIEAKGAEYKQVVLYGFGEYYIENFGNIEKGENKKNDFIINYFFNKLYVAITRAQTELIIVDSKRSQELFWEKLVNKMEITNPAWDILNDKKDKTIEYNTSTINNVLQSTRDDALENARIDKKLGEYNNNPARLKVAANQFFKLGYEKDANECLAIAEEIKYNYKLAGDYYLEAKKTEKASMAYFQARHFLGIEKIGTNLKTIEQDIRLIIIRIIGNIPIKDSELNTISKRKEELNAIVKELSWRRELVSELFKYYEEIEKIDQKRDFIEMLSYILKEDDNEYIEKIADIFYSLDMFNKAIENWEIIDKIDIKEYVLAKIKVSNTSEDKVIWKSELIYFLDTKEEIISICKEIIDINASIDSDNLSKEYCLALYKAFIYINDCKNIKNIGEKVEKYFDDDLKKLKLFYKDLLNDKNLNKSLFTFLIERYAKINFKINSENYLEELNNTYKDIAKDKKILYKKFTQKELENISEYPESITTNPSEHLSSIEINNFRCFDSIKLDNIGKYNLILGDNNIGKTSLLEALLFTDNDELYFKNMLFAYTTRVNSFDILKEPYKQTNEIIVDAINKNKDIDNFHFIINENRNEWDISFRTPTENELKNKYPNIENITTDNYICKIDSEKNISIKSISKILQKNSSSDLINSQFIPFGKGFDRDLVKAYSDYIDRDKTNRDIFLESMKVFIPNIDRITVDTKNSKIFIEESTFPNDKPLHYYGEGSKKLFRILVQIILQKNKKLLIDEIDAGIHYSHFEEFWKIILKAAKKQNVQIFATTHNIECIKYFKDILETEDFKEYQKYSRTITLKKLPDDSIKAYIREYNEFEYELDNELEIRGGKL